MPESAKPDERIQECRGLATLLPCRASGRGVLEAQLALALAHYRQQRIDAHAAHAQPQLMRRARRYPAAGPPPQLPKLVISTPGSSALKKVSASRRACSRLAAVVFTL